LWHFATAQERVQSITTKMKDKIAAEKERRAAFDERLKRLKTQLASIKQSRLRKLHRKLKRANDDLHNYSTPSLSSTL
jgi:septal ring factor EnvC (AmiA/AmiB activator)